LLPLPLLLRLFGVVHWPWTAVVTPMWLCCVALLCAELLDAYKILHDLARLHIGIGVCICTAAQLAALCADAYIAPGHWTACVMLPLLVQLVLQCMTLLLDYEDKLTCHVHRSNVIHTCMHAVPLLCFILSALLMCLHGDGLVLLPDLRWPVLPCAVGLGCCVALIQVTCFCRKRCVLDGNDLVICLICGSVLLAQLMGILHWCGVVLPELRLVTLIGLVPLAVMWVLMLVYVIWAQWHSYQSMATQERFMYKDVLTQKYDDLP